MKATSRFSSPVRRLTGVLLGLLLAGSVTLAQTTPTKVLVADVIPQGLHAVPPQRVMSQIRTRPGGEYKKDVLDEDLRALTKTGLFYDVKAYEQTMPDGRVNVYLVFVEYPSRVQEIVYQGAKHFSPEDLNAVVASSGLRRGDTLNPTINRMARQAIVNHYLEKGRLLANVELVEGGNPGDTRVVFNITEGPVIHVQHIDFVGNTFVTGARLRTQVDSSRAFLGLLGGQYNPMMVEHDIGKLEEYYRTFGFHDVRVERELRWDTSFRNVSLIFHVHEGVRYRVANVDVDGMKSAGHDEMLHVSQLRPGEWYNQGKVKVDERNMSDYLGFMGHSATVREQDFYDPNKPGEVQVRYDVMERPPARVGQVIVVGNDVTRDRIIRRQVPLYPGQVLTYPDLRRAEANLARLNIFETNAESGVRPTVTVLDPEGDEEFKDVLVQVQETRTGSLMFGVGVNSDAGLTGSIVLNERNFDITKLPTSWDQFLSGQAFRGAGQELRIEAVPGTQVQRYTATWREPFLFDSPYSLTVGGYYYERSFNEYNEDRLGARVTVGRRIGEHWTVSTGFRIEEVGVHDVVFFAPPDYLDAVGNHFLFAPRVGLTYDTRDSYLRATQGFLFDASAEECLGDYTFPVLNLEGNYYHTIYQRADGSGRHVLALHSQVSWAGSNAPVYERFFAGGFRSMRGFEFRGVGPDIDGFKVGGDFMFLNSLEYQIPIRANDALYMVAFVDSGTVESQVEIKNYRVTAGVGLRIQIPMMGPVPIALDFGFPIVKAETDNTQIFSFWVGFFR
jgi:outer membrane protein assembly complex protein YaeT